MIVTSITSVSFRVLPDDNADASYLEQPGFEDRLRQYQQGLFSFVGVQAVVTVRSRTSGTTTQVKSAGVWGIEDDSGDEYFREVGDEELLTIMPELKARGINIDGIRPGLGDKYAE